MPNLSRRAVEYVVKYEKKQGREVLNVESDPKFRGFDLFSFSKDRKDIKTIEVKGTESKDCRSIPDCHETEFTRNKKLIATHMYVVNFHSHRKGSPDLYIIEANKFKPEHLEPLTRYRIKSSFLTKVLPGCKQDKKLKPFTIS